MATINLTIDAKDASKIAEALNRGALFHSGRGIKGEGPLFCAACAPARIKRAILACVRLDAETKELADV